MLSIVAVAERAGGLGWFICTKRPQNSWTRTVCLWRWSASQRRFFADSASRGSASGRSSRLGLDTDIKPLLSHSTTGEFNS
eukprot:1176304-Prorocentrum_minimum.AAC.2